MEAKRFDSPSSRKWPIHSVNGFSLDSRRGRDLGLIASGDFRYLRAAFRGIPKSSAIPRMERLVPFIS